MEGIETADARLAQIYPKSDFEKKDQDRETRAFIAINALKMDRLEKLYVPPGPISLIIHHDKKL